MDVFTACLKYSHPPRPFKLVVFFSYISVKAAAICAPSFALFSIN